MVAHLLWEQEAGGSNPLSPTISPAGLHAPDAGMKGLDPIVLLDAVLGTPENIGAWEDDLLAYAASQAPMPRNKREKPSVSPSDLPQRLQPLGNLRAKALLQQAFGDLDQTSSVLERLAEAIRILDETTPADTANEAARGGTAKETTRAGTTARPQTKSAGRRRMS